MQLTTHPALWAVVDTNDIKKAEQCRDKNGKILFQGGDTSLFQRTLHRACRLMGAYADDVLACGRKAIAQDVFGKIQALWKTSIPLDHF
eukprot:4729981-Amphidinium_carterae.1